MSLCKRGGIWWIDVRARDGERIRRTTGTANKALAQEAHDRFKSELWRIGHLGDKPRHTWNDAVVRWLKEQSHKATAGEDVSKLRWLHRYLGGKDLTHITRATLDQIIDAKLALGHRNATVNRTLEPRSVHLHSPSTCSCSEQLPRAGAGAGKGAGAGARDLIHAASSREVGP
jgi:hypothetical protein